MTTDAEDDRIVEAITHLRSAMSLLNQAGALQAAAHVATAIFCMPAVGTVPSGPARAGAPVSRWSELLAEELTL